MMHKVFWVWAQQVFGEGSALPWYIYRNFPGGLEGFFRSGPRLWNSLDYITEQQVAAMGLTSLEAARAKLEYAVQLGWETVTPECEKYPGELRNISDPPAVLYSKGGLPGPEDGPLVAVVGARKALEESQEAAKSISYQLASGGAAVVTGEAPGIDSAALSGTLSALGKAVCVLPVDLGSPYMAKTGRLRQRVLETGGVLVTEYFSQRNPAQGGFHLRNRLITGLCQKVVLVQAAEKSGTMIYARHAAKQGRKLFVYPGPPDAPEFAGSRRLIAEGAAPVRSGGEVLEEDGARVRAGAFPAPKPLAPEYAQEDWERPVPMLADSGGGSPPEQEALLTLLESGEKTADELEEQSGLPLGTLLKNLTLLELAGKIETVPGRRYRRR